MALPLIVPAITNADSLAAYTCSGCVSQVWRWVASAQDWQARLPGVFRDELFYADGRGLFSAI